MRKILIFMIICIFTVLYISIFIITEGQRGIVLHFGKVLRDHINQPLIYHPGLHIKIPFIETVKILDARLQTMENQADRFVTMEKKDLIIDSYIKWCISDFSRYYLATGGGDVSQAEILLKRKFSDRLRSEIGRLNVKEIVTDSRNRLMIDVRDSLNQGTSGENEEIQTTILENDVIPVVPHIENYSKVHSNSIIHSNSMANLGIKVVDVRIKQINLPSEVSDAIYQRMRAERDAVARRHRSKGQEEAEKLRAATDYQVTCILSHAEHQALIMKGEADAVTSKLYAHAFGKDPEFYSFIRSLRAYENSFQHNDDFMVLNSENDFFRFMKISDNMVTKYHS